MAKSAYQLWKEAKAKEDQRKAEGKIHFKEDSRASRVQTTLPQYSGQSKDKSYKWETDLLKPLSIKQYGRSYNDKFDKWANSQGVDANSYRTQMDFEEDRKKEGHYAHGAMYENEVIDGIFKSMNNRIEQSKQTMKAKALEPKVEPKKEPKKQAVKETTKKKSNTTLWDDLKAAGKTAYQGFNPFDDVTMEEAFKNYTERNTSKTFDEIARGSNRAVDSASLGAMSNLDKKVNNRDPYYLSQREFGEGGGTDMLTTGLGYLAPGLGMYKGLNALKTGIGLTQFGSKGIGQRLASEAAKGAIIGAGMSGTEVGIREGLNPDDYNWKQNLGYIGMNTGIGAVADPLIYGAGKGIAKGFETAANRTMKNLLPGINQVEEALKGAAKTNQAENALPIARQNLDDLIPRGNDIVNPNYVPSLTPRPRPQLDIPKVGTPLEEALANPRLDVAEPPKPIETPVQPARQQEAPVNINTPEPPVKPVQEPVNAPQEPVARPATEPKPNERRFYNTVQNPNKLSPEMEQLLNDFDKTYKPMSNEDTVKFANEYVKNDMEKAYQFVKNATKFDPRHVTVGHRLIDELQKAGDYNKALDVVERLAEQGTKAGQSIQSYSIYNRLSAEGQLLRAQRRVNKINETITDPTKEVKLTPQNVEDITHTADSIQKFAGQMDQANNVMRIMDEVKKGKIATDSELNTIRSFVTDAKKFFGDLDPASTPKAPKPVKDARTRDKVVDFMTKREDVAREELKKIFGRANSLPVDAFYHLSVIGASKIAKGTIKLADFTEEMVKEFGEHIRPYMQQIYNKASETFNLQSESMTRQRLSEVEKITNKALKDKNLSVDEVESIKEFAQRVGQMSGDAKLESSMELQTILQTLERPTFGQKLSTAQTIAQLLNPKTMVRNALGNEMFYRIERMNKLLATPVDIARSKLTGGERTVTFKTNNQGQYWKNWLTGAKAGWKGVNPMGLTTAYDLGPQAFRSKWNPLTYFEKSLGATLRSFDHAGYMRAYNNTLGEIATLKAVNQGLTGQAKKEAIAQFIREADENMIQLADKYGKYSTFQDNTALSTGLQKVKRTMNLKKDFGLGDLVLKYPKTPGNLVMRALEYSPAGVVRSAYLMKHAIKGTKPLATREATEALTRAIIGTTGFSLMGYALADLGILTGSGSSDYELASLEKSAGKQSNSVNVTALMRFVTSGFDADKASSKQGDTFISYDWAQPLAIAVALGVGVNQTVKENDDVNPISATKGAFDGASSTVLEMSVLSGLKDFLTSYPGKKPSDYLVNPAKNIVSSFVPTLFNQVRQLSDNEAKTTYSPNLLPEIGNKAINRVPGANKLLPPAFDTLGNERKNFQNDSNNLFNVLLNPSFVSKYDPSSEAEFVLNAINETGDKNLAPRMAQKKLDGKPLTSEQYAEMQRIMGEEVRSGLQEIMYMEGGNPEELSKAIEKVLREAGKVAREAIRSQRGE
jgi:hypothetical protein